MATVLIFSGNDVAIPDFFPKQCGHSSLFFGKREKGDWLLFISVAQDYPAINGEKVPVPFFAGKNGDIPHYCLAVGLL
ncbi:MAG: hypothetical protein OER85_13000, partial [Gammaproteobacteria bacterium]|nr:hypothetical protein [Gammaproteobacteria bacterium]